MNSPGGQYIINPHFKNERIEKMKKKLGKKIILKKMF